MPKPCTGIANGNSRPLSIWGERKAEPSETRMPTTIAFVNQKGGCGKSSCCFHLAGALAERGTNVLLVDADPQGSLSQAFFGSEEIEDLAPDDTLARLFRGDAWLADDSALITPTEVEHISIVRANHTLAEHNTPVPESTGMLQYALAEFVELLTGFDFVLIDCPPNIYLCSWNAMLTADFVAVPVPPEDFGTQGLRIVHQSIDAAAGLNPKLELLGHVVTRHDKRLLVHRVYEQKLRTLYGDAVLATLVPECSAFKLALTCRRPVTHFEPESRAARVIRSLADEVVQRAANAIAARRAA